MSSKFTRLAWTGVTALVLGMAVSHSLAPSEIPAVPVNHAHTIHIHQRICGMKSCHVVDVYLHPRVI